MLAALDKFDLETVATLGHNLAGSGTSFGFPVISAIGATIQTTAEAADQNGARDGIVSLMAFLDGVMTAGSASIVVFKTV